MRYLYLFFILFIFSEVSFASEKITCEQHYLNNKKNPLFNLSLVGGNTNNINDENSDELIPDKEIKDSGNNNWIQYYFLSKYHHYRYILLLCVYNNGQSVVKEIPKSAHTCIKKYTLAATKPDQSYITKFSCY